MNQKKVKRLRREYRKSLVPIEIKDEDGEIQMIQPRFNKTEFKKIKHEHRRG